MVKKDRSTIITESRLLCDIISSPGEGFLWTLGIGRVVGKRDTLQTNPFLWPLTSSSLLSDPPIRPSEGFYSFHPLVLEYDVYTPEPLANRSSQASPLSHTFFVNFLKVSRKSIVPHGPILNQLRQVLEFAADPWFLSDQHAAICFHWVTETRTHEPPTLPHPST
nr:hypothetical protein L203_00070 [Cryptococcus depauperatus CBS 7841]